ncbi:gamma-glutamyl-gamma-aminobutyrate hydrolase family protein [Aeromicrobium sp. 9AM]|uniref:gamma-glutamyl-gamma-aminobutyrate hydrolase family protein n=1 Tax=Aeromicrobium sp. 9AM TaxID=2653126 RepID=UPI001F3B8134|nr:gamma-glutamyl-gamma-aminobutyrate hydrolase family protein [Aeromicrobium sp. 9AM]
MPARFAASTSALRYGADVVATKLAESIFAAGGEPWIIHPVVPEGTDEAGLDELVRQRIQPASGVVLPGGGDLAARWFGASPGASDYDVDELQDAFDFAVARVALASGIPMLAICRGAQVVNVARGGDLVQDLRYSVGADHRHRVHRVRLLEDSAIARLLGADATEISCYHHQGVRRLGDGLQASALAEDGTIESIELAGHEGWFLGVQWHPEDTSDVDPHQATLFRALVDAARDADSRPRAHPSSSSSAASTLRGIT